MVFLHFEPGLVLVTDAFFLGLIERLEKLSDTAREVLCLQIDKTLIEEVLIGADA